tara:strand:- start:7733 stop:7888 length:156 start_codon:yes stop_codon:yes gene_type:complete
MKLTQEQTLRIHHVIRNGIDENSHLLGCDLKRCEVVINIQNKVYDIIKGVK